MWQCFLRTAADWTTADPEQTPGRDSFAGHTADKEERARHLARCWDDAKLEAVVGYWTAAVDCATKMHNFYRQQLRRLHARLRAADLGEEPNRGEFEVTRNKAVGGPVGPESAASLRTRIVERKADWHRMAALRRECQLAQRLALSTIAFSRRVAAKFGDNTVYAVGSARVGASAPKQLANAMAAGWASVMRVPRSATAERVAAETYMGTVPDNLVVGDVGYMASAFTADEVARAIAGCKRGKAVGPDQLGNDWYQDHADQLGPILTALFNSSWEAGVVPRSFSGALIACLNKTKAAKDALDYRPIALLNADYKIYTRVLANRLRGCVANMVSESQDGFVPGRTIHATIDTLRVAQRQAAERGHEEGGYGLLLDFAKAYDSLSREFLLAALVKAGLPPRFVGAVRSLHDETSCCFLVNGYESRSVRVTRGIRQGRPLAPMLVIVALDTLYRAVMVSATVRGVPVQANGEWRELTVCGYADDTALCVSDLESAEAATEELRRFSGASGLQVNVDKSVAIGLAGPTTPLSDLKGSTRATVPDWGRVRLPESRARRWSLGCRYSGLATPVATSGSGWTSRTLRLLNGRGASIHYGCGCSWRQARLIRACNTRNWRGPSPSPRSCSLHGIRGLDRPRLPSCNHFSRALCGGGTRTKAASVDGAGTS